MCQYQAVYIFINFWCFYFFVFKAEWQVYSQ